jgi:hypothetical protein
MHAEVAVVQRSLFVELHRLAVAGVGLGSGRGVDGRSYAW